MRRDYNASIRNDYMTLAEIIYIVYTFLPIVPTLLPQILRYGIILAILGLQTIALFASSEIDSRPVFMFIGSVILTLLMYIGKWRYANEPFISYFAATMYFWIPLGFSGYYRYISSDSWKRAKKLMLICIVITAISTISGNITYPEVSRLLAGAASAAEKDRYSSYNIGSYGFVYGCVFLLPLVLFSIKTAVNFRAKITYCTIAVILLITLVITQFSTAWGLLFVEIALLWILNSKDVMKNALLLTVILLLLFFMKGIIAGMLRDFSDLLLVNGLTQVADRFVAFANLLTGDEVSGSTGHRLILYQNSWKAFLNSPLYGNLISERTALGRHSEWLDILGGTGIVGSYVFFLLMRSHKSNLAALKETPFYKNCIVVFISFAIFGAIDTVFAAYNVGAVLFWTPMLWGQLPPKEKQRTNSYEHR